MASNPLYVNPEGAAHTRTEGGDEGHAGICPDSEPSGRGSRKPFPATPATWPPLPVTARLPGGYCVGVDAVSQCSVGGIGTI